jgi:hypothetical protein
MLFCSNEVEPSEVHARAPTPSRSAPYPLRTPAALACDSMEVVRCWPPWLTDREAEAQVIQGLI